MSKLPTLTVRLPAAIKKRLLTLSEVTRIPAYELVERALAALWEILPEEVRRETQRRLDHPVAWRPDNDT